MKRILYVWKSPYPWDIRIEKICRSLADYGFKVTILCRGGSGENEREIIDNYEIIRIGINQPSWKSSPFFYNPFWIKEISNIVKEIKPDLIINREFFLAEASKRAAKKFDIPVIMDMAENYPAVMKIWDKYKSGLISKILIHKLSLPEKIEKSNIKNLAGIITVCEEQNIRLITNYHFPSEKIVTVNNTPPKNQFDRTIKGCRKTPIVFGHHGHLSSDKNFDIFLEGFDIAAKEMNDIFINFYGDGFYKEHLEKLTEKLNISNRVKFFGKYKFAELPDLLSEIDIGILPYLTTEFINTTLYNKLFDFLAAGKPVIVSEAIPMKRIINETRAGIIVDCTEPKKIADVILNIRNYNLEEISKNGMKAVSEKYNWETDSNILINFINKLI